MVKITYKGVEYPIYEIDMKDVYGGESCHSIVSERALWEVLEKDLENDVQEAINLDERIMFYLEDGFLSNNPSYECVISVLKQELSEEDDIKLINAANEYATYVDMNGEEWRNDDRYYAFIAGSNWKELETKLNSNKHGR